MPGRRPRWSGACLPSRPRTRARPPGRSPAGRQHPDAGDLEALLDEGQRGPHPRAATDLALRRGRGHRMAAGADRATHPSSHRSAAGATSTGCPAPVSTARPRPSSTPFRSSPTRPGNSLPTASAAHGVEPSGQLLMLLLALLELDRLICSGRRSSGVHTYAAFADRVPSPRRLDRDEALAELALRYFTGHGPATERDLAYWATLTLGDVRRGLTQVQDRLASFDHDGRTFWHAPDESPPTKRRDATGASAADPRRDLPRLPGQPDGARQRGHRSQRSRDRDRHGAGRRTDGRRDETHSRPTCRLRDQSVRRAAGTLAPARLWSRPLRGTGHFSASSTNCSCAESASPSEVQSVNWYRESAGGSLWL